MGTEGAARPGPAFSPALPSTLHSDRRLFARVILWSQRALDVKY